MKDAESGASTRSVPLRKKLQESNETRNVPRWYVLRAAYGKERHYFQMMTQENYTVYCPTIRVRKRINGKLRNVTESRIPNIFFAYGTLDELKKAVYDNVRYPHLRFYYAHRHRGATVEKEPLVIPDAQLESLRIICEAREQDTIVSATDIAKFRIGRKVRVIAGPFEGVVGRVARFKGQQRVGISFNGFAAVATAYVPTGMMELLEDEV